MIDTRTAPYAALLLRVSLGAMLLAHGLLLKVFTFTIPGTVGYFPPEVFERGARPDPRLGDIYALGLMLFGMAGYKSGFLTGEFHKTSPLARIPVLDLGGVWTKTLHYLEQSVAHWMMRGGALPVMVPAVDADSIAQAALRALA